MRSAAVLGEQDDVTFESWRVFDVVLSGAFLTGQPLQVRVSESHALQRTLGDALAARVGQGWAYDALDWQDAGGSYDGAGGYPSLVPLVLVRRGGEDLTRAVREAIGSRPTSERDWLDRMTSGWTWRLRDVSIDIFDFGTGVVRCAYEVEPPASLSVADVRRTVDLLSRLKPDAAEQVQPPLAAALEAVTRATVAQLSEEIGRTVAQARQRPWLAPMVRALGDRAQADQGPADRSYRWGRLLWLHPIVVLSAPPGCQSSQLDAIAQPFKSDFHRSMDISYGLFVPGIDISVIVGRGGPTRAREPFLWLTSLNWAYYALFTEIDRGLLATLDDERWQTNASLAELERDADEMFRVHMRVQNVHARLGSILMDIGGGALTLWTAIVEAQQFDALVAAVQVKVDLLQRVAERRVQQAATVRARRTGNILRGLSALTLVTVVTAIIGSLVGSRSDTVGHTWVRIGAVALAAALACALFVVQRDIATKRERVRVARRRASLRSPTSPGAEAAGSVPPTEPQGYGDAPSLNL